MPMKFTQQPRALLMVRPASFGFNESTAESNTFQRSEGQNAEALLKSAQSEFDRMVDLLASHEIDVHVFSDPPHPPKPDAIFPNNWISFHEDGTVILYPMLAANRRLERRSDIMDVLKKEFAVTRVIDLSAEENNDMFLEGTGSLVFDHVNRIAYACRSPRTHPALVVKVCKELGYRPVIFNAVDEKGISVYHTNVLMAVSEKFAIMCLDAIKEDTDQELLLAGFASSGHKVIAISYAQMYSFAGNMIEVFTRNGEPVVLMSETAFKSLLPGQIQGINRYSEILPVSVETIEKVGGGGVRCMVAGIHLPKGNQG
jgi:hypothetical protein